MSIERVCFVPRRYIEHTSGRADSGLLTFHDVGNQPHQALPGWAAHASFSFSDADAPHIGQTLLTPQMAKDIVAYVQKGASQWRELVVSCELGLSRSAAAALLFSEMYAVPCYAGTMPVDAQNYRIYNRHVYRQLHAAAFGPIVSWPAHDV